jgi:aspartate aminotransferase-like enzyme
MREDFLLVNPEPVPVTREVRRAVDPPAVSHRSVECEAVSERTRDGLDHVFERSTRSPGGERRSHDRSPNGDGRR